MKRLLVVFANSFPYHISEPFLANEFPLYKDYFDKVLMVTNGKKGEKPTREINDPTIELITDYTLSKDLKSVLEAVPWMLTDKMFYREVKNLFSKGFSFKKLYDMAVVSLCANHRAKQALKWLKRNPDCCPSVLYGTWLYTPAYAAVRLNSRLKKKCFLISRAHGFDVYSERHETQYIPFQKQLFYALDEISAISDNGKEYLEKKYGSEGRVRVNRLGALDREKKNPYSDRRIFRIVSCSRVIPLKRLDRVADALRRIDNRCIHWTHIGDGEDFEKLKDRLNNFPENITVNLLGRVPNERVYDIYSEQPFHAFVNVSETEGAPVSIMEAMSFSIPAIATAVGGTPELVVNAENGILLDSDFTDEELIDAILKMADMSEEDYLSYRNKSRKKFKDDYSAISNNRRFLKYLSEK